MNQMAVSDSSVPIELDLTDQGIIELLRGDGRKSYRAIARQLAITEATVRARVKRMEESNTLRVVAVIDTEAAGFGMLLAVGVQVENRSPEAVAQEMAAIAEVFSVSVVVGTHDIEILVVAKDQAGLNKLLNETLSRVPGVRRLTPSLAVDVLKNQPDWVPFNAS